MLETRSRQTPLLDNINKKFYYCDLTLKFLNCMNNIFDKLCKTTENAKKSSSVLYSKMSKAIVDYNNTYNNYCSGK